VIVDAAYGIGQLLMAKYDSTAGATGIYNTGTGTDATATPYLGRAKTLEASSAAGDLVAIRFVDGGVTGIMG
jgi:hypothetical protein